MVTPPTTLTPSPGSDPNMIDFTDLAATPSVRLPLTLTALSEISHGAGNAGNTQKLRTRPIMTPRGRATVPFISGNSLRHEVRAALAWYLVRTLEVKAGSLPKPVVDLIWSGGALSTTGSQADLDMNRRIHQLIPGLGLLGYSAKSDIVSGVLWAEFVDVVCAETRHILPPHLADHPNTQYRSGVFRVDQLGTRHDTAGSPAGRFIALAEGQTEADTVQMIYKTQTLRTGTVLSTQLKASVPTAGHVAALAVGFNEAAPSEGGERIIHLGGKRATGFGRCRVEADTSVFGDLDSLIAQYHEHMVAHRNQILELLDEVTR